MSEPLAQGLAALNTTLIVISGLALGLGYYFIRSKRVLQHRRSMVTATVFAGLFLAVYVARYLMFEPRIFAGAGLVRVAYLAILLSHTLLAIVLGPLVLVTLRRGLRADYGRHRAIARITLPIWAYVAATGWIIYLMLYRLA